jgi:lipid-A-disaccharide synthase
MGTRESPAILLSAGEASGDLHGSTLCRALRELCPGVRLAGMGGPRMAAEGLELLADPTGQAVVGATEAIGRLPALYRAYRALARRLRREPPLALVLIDFPEFNLRLARVAHRAGVPVVYFIPPQVWAWRPGRVRGVARLASRVLSVFPFERELYERAGVSVDFVGHPLLDVLPLDLGREEARRRLELEPETRVVGLLPGSRREEVARLLAPMLDAARRLAQAGGRRFVLGLAPSVSRAGVETAVADVCGKGGPPIEIVTGQTHELMAGADVLLVASGTATLEAALLGTPMVVCYRVSLLTEVVGRLLVRIPWISLPNIVCGRPVVPEILQREVTGERLAVEAERLLGDPAAAVAQRRAFGELATRLGEPGVARRAARAVLDAARIGGEA